jgi:hypothetical protein
MTARRCFRRVKSRPGANILRGAGPRFRGPGAPVAGDADWSMSIHMGTGRRGHNPCGVGDSFGHGYPVEDIHRKRRFLRGRRRS